MITAVRILGSSLLGRADPAAAAQLGAAWAVRLWLEGEAARLGVSPAGVLAEPDARPPDHALTAAREALQDELDAGEPDAIGAAYERLLACRAGADASGLTLTPARSSARRAQGAFYTPVFLVEHLLDLALEPVVASRTTEPEILSIRVCDPACGSGRFLVAAAARLGDHLARARHGADPTPEQRRAARADITTRCLFGADIDPVGVDLCRARLWLGSCAPGVGGAEPGTHLRVGDPLAGDLPGREGGFDVVVGNPPFLGALRTATALGRDRIAAFARAWDADVGPYTDAAGCFLLLGVACTRAGGRVGLVQPVSVLAARDAGPVRRGVLERASPAALWLSGGAAFAGTGVRTCAPVLEVGGPRRRAMARTLGLPVRALAPVEVDADAAGAGAWAGWGAGGAPRVEVGEGQLLGSVARATADFRDQYYGLAGLVVEDADLPEGTDPSLWPAVVTSGLIDPGWCRWGQRPTRLHGRAWAAPRADLARLRAGPLGAWAAARLAPKVLVATQTRVIEAVVDEAGVLLPSTPVITVTPEAERWPDGRWPDGRASRSDPPPGPLESGHLPGHRARLPLGSTGGPLWHIAAAVSSPVVSAWAAERFGGAALSADAIKVSAKQLMQAPLPRDAAAWGRGAVLLCRASGEGDAGCRLALLGEFGAVMAGAYGLDAERAVEVLAWWRGRLAPGRRGAGGMGGAGLAAGAGLSQPGPACRRKT